MPLVLKTIAAIAAVSLIFTIWLVLTILSAGGLSRLLNAGPLGQATLIGWAVTLVLAPITAVQLWKLRNAGRIAGLVLFTSGALYYLAGLFWLRTAEASPAQIVLAAAGYAVPAVILALPAARRACVDATRQA